jgi:glycosyltransferase involved in cell wall biosynthesis
MRTAVFSIFSPNYRHFVKVLMASLRRHQPEWDRFVLVVGDAEGAEDNGFTTVSIDALPLPDRQRFCFRYSLLELNTAVKPWMFEHLFARGYDRVVFFDPDIVVYSPLAELETEVADTFITLTPHLTGPIGGDAHPSERTILLAGSYNLGFLSVRRQPQLERFLKWWQEKVEFQCIVDTARGLFVDQKWMDLVPGLFDGVSILRHDGYNVAYWNVRQRTIAADGSAFTVNGQPLRFFHFSGYDPSLRRRVSRHTDVTFAEVGDAGPLFREYAEALQDAGWQSFRHATYPFGKFTDGTPIPYAARAAYRNSPELQETAGADPFQRPELFLSYRDRSRARWLAKAGLASYRFFSRGRAIVKLVPRPLRTSIREHLLGRKELPSGGSANGALPPGLNIAGYVSRDTGVGESARLCAAACEAAGIPYHLVDVDARGGFEPHPVYRATVHHVNADQLPAVHSELRRLFDGGAYNIGVWHWELPELPDAWVHSAAPLDEIWAPSAFVQSAVSRKVTIPVVHMPHGVAVTDLEPCSPEELGVPPGRFTFLFAFDLGSVVERKNPLAAVEAFRRAFDGSSNAALLIKAGRSDRHPAEYAELQERLRGVPNVHLSDRILPRARVNGLIAACDGVLSLHRAEGFGLLLAEAMYLGKPVVATGWSGNMDFMDSGNSCPVAYELVTLAETHEPYQAGEQWAEPDLDHAAHLLRRLVEDDAYRLQLAQRAQTTMRTRFSPQAAGLRYHRRLAFLGLMDGESHRPA